MQKAQDNRLKGFLKKPFLKMDRKAGEEKKTPAEARPDKRYFLVDFENVGTDGIEDAGHLTASDFVHLFCTKNSAKICPSVLAGFNSTNLFVHVVPQGSQSVDMHIVSFLGNLIGEKDSRGGYIIVSKDTDYDNVIHFWQTERNALVKRQEKLIEAGEPEDSCAGREASKPASAQMTNKKTGAVSEQKKVKKQASPAGRDAAKKAAAKPEQKRVKKQALPAGPDAAKKQAAKPEQKAAKKEASPAEQKPAQEKTPADRPKEAASKAEKDRIAKDKVKLNSSVMKALSTAKYDNSVIGFVSSQAAKHYSDANRKQVMHGVIVQKYGQEKGLEIYKKIREFL